MTMKKQQSKIIFGLSLFIVVSIALFAFQDSTKIKKENQQAIKDTVPKNKNMDIDIDIKMKDIDKVIKESMNEVNKSLKAIEWNKIPEEVNNSLQKIDFTKMQAEIEKSMKSIDWKKMQMEIDRSMKEIDWNKIKNEINYSMNDIDKDKMHREMEKAMIEVRESLKESQKINTKELKKEMEKVKEEMKKAKNELSDIKEMQIDMEKDGLINKKEGYNIEYKNKELLINGKKQPQEVTEKYRKYFKGENFKMKRSKED